MSSMTEETNAAESLLSCRALDFMNSCGVSSISSSDSHSVSEHSMADSNTFAQFGIEENAEKTSDSKGLFK